MATAEDAAVVQRPTHRARASLAVPAGVVLALILAGLAVGLVVSRGKAASYPPSSPEGVVQRYLGDLQDGKVDAAYELTDRSRTRSDFHMRLDNWGRQSHRVTLVSTGRHGTEATVTVDISTFSAGPPGASDSSQRVTFTLVRPGGAWRVSDPAYLPY